MANDLVESAAYLQVALFYCTLCPSQPAMVAGQYRDSAGSASCLAIRPRRFTFALIDCRHTKACSGKRAGVDERLCPTIDLLRVPSGTSSGPSVHVQQGPGEIRARRDANPGRISTWLASQ